MSPAGPDTAKSGRITASWRSANRCASWPVAKRMKALRFRLIALPGRVVSHARKLIIRLGAGAEALTMIVTARQTIRALRCGPAG